MTELRLHRQVLKTCTMLCHYRTIFDWAMSAIFAELGKWADGDCPLKVQAHLELRSDQPRFQVCYADRIFVVAMAAVQGHSDIKAQPDLCTGGKS